MEGGRRGRRTAGRGGVRGLSPGGYGVSERKSLRREADTEDYPGLVADVQEKVTEMTGEKWREKAEELEEVLRTVER